MTCYDGGRDRFAFLVGVASSGVHTGAAKLAVGLTIALWICVSVYLYSRRSRVTPSIFRTLSPLMSMDNDLLRDIGQSAVLSTIRSLFVVR